MTVGASERAGVYTMSGFKEGDRVRWVEESDNISGYVTYVTDDWLGVYWDDGALEEYEIAHTPEIRGVP